MKNIFDPYHYLLEDVVPAFTTTRKNEIVRFFKNNQYPNDKQIHDFATELGVSPEQLEREIYYMFTNLLRQVGEF